MGMNKKTINVVLHGAFRDNFDPDLAVNSSFQFPYAITNSQTFPITIAGSNGGGNVGTLELDVDDIDRNNLVGVTTASVGLAVNPDGNLDLWRNNGEQTIFGASARTVTTDSADFTNYNWKGLHIIFNVQSPASGFSLVPIIQGKDPISNIYYPILIGDNIAVEGTTILKIYPGIGQIPGGTASDILPRVWRLRVEVGDATAVTYTANANLVL